MKGSDLRLRLREGRTAVGTFVNAGSPDTVEVLGHSGFDFVIVDCEHAGVPMSNMANVVRSAEVSGVAAIVRIARLDTQLIAQALDTGAVGIQVPQVATTADADLAARSSRFFPRGSRTLAPSRSSRYGQSLGDAYFTSANDSVLVSVQIETLDALTAVEEIAAVEGVDILFLGPLDMSAALGVPARVGDASVLRAATRVAEAAIAAGKVAGIAVGTAGEANRMLTAGFRFVTISSDLGLVGQAAASVLAEVGARRDGALELPSLEGV